MSIDNRIVNMVFNNKQFEEGVSETTDSLEKLKKSLDFSSSSIDLSSITSSLEGLTGHFTTFLGRLKAKFIDTFVTDIVNESKKLFNQAVVEPIKDGFNEYELKMGSVQTILNSAFNRSGAAVTLEEVSTQLEELNKYADRTIYSFKDMTANIGKFTNAGVALEDAVAAIQGVSNVAAVSGANAAEASRAMYNFAQALSSGYVKLIDWKSIENANMATVEFKNQLLESAVAAGTLEKTADGMYRVLSGGGYKENGVEQYISATSHFNDSLSKAWMTTEVLTTTLSRYSDETTEIGKKAFAAATEVKTLSQAWDTLKESAGSTWAQTWETIFGDLNQGKELWTRLEQDLEEIFVKGGDRRNELLKEWSDSGGRDFLFSTSEENLGALWNLLDAVKQIIDVVKKAFSEVFGSVSAFKLNKLTYNFQQFTKSLVLGSEQADKVKNIFKGFFSAIALIKDVVVAVVKPIKMFFESLTAGNRGNIVLSTFENIAKTITSFRENVLNSRALEKVSKYFGTVYSALGDASFGIFDIINRIINLFKGIGDDFFFIIDDEIVRPVTLLQKIFASLYSILQRVAIEFTHVIATILGKDPEEAEDAVAVVFRKIRDAVYHFYVYITDLDLVKKMKDFWNSFKVPGGGFLDGIKNFFSNIKDWISNVVGNLHPLELLKNLIKAIFDLVKNVVTAIGPTLVSVGSFTVKIITGLIEAGGKLFQILGQSLKDGTFGALLTGGINIGIGVGVFKAFSSFSDFIKTLTGAFSNEGAVAKLLNNIGGAFNAFQQQVKAKELKATAISIALLAASIVVLASIDTASMAIATGAIIGLMEGLSHIMVTMSAIQSTRGLSTIGTTLIKMGASVLVLAAALKVIASVDPDRLAGSMLALTVMLGELVAVVKILGSGKNIRSLKSVGQGLIELSAALLIMAVAVKAFGSMDGNQVSQGLKAVSLLLAELVIFTKIAGNTKRMASIGAGLILLSDAILVLVASVAILGHMKVDSLVKGMSMFTILLSEITLIAFAFDQLNPAKVAAVSASMLILGAAMLEVSGAVALLAAMKLDKLAGAVAAFSLVLLEMVGALWVLSDINPARLIASAGALVIMGAALLEMSIALKVLSTMSLGEMLIAVGSLALTLTLLGAAAVVLGPLAPAMLAVAGAFALFGVAALALGAGLTLISVGLAAFSGTVVVSMAALLEAIKIGITALPEILAALADSLGKSFKSIVSLLATLIKSICEAIKETVPEIVDTILVVIDKVLTSIGDHIQSIVESLLRIIVGVLDGLANGIPDIIASAVNLLKSIFEALKSSLGDMSASTILEAIGIAGLLTILMTELAALSALALVATLSLPSIGKNLSEFMTEIQPFLDGIKNVGSETLEGAEALASAILALTVSSIIEGITRWITGKSSFESFGKELAAFGPYLKTYNDSIKGINNASITASAEAVKTMAEMANDLPNSGGIVSWFTGDNTLSDFGEMLAEFGPYFAKYASSVAGISPAAITASASAAAALAEMANNLPNSGGIISWITGDNTLADFGKMLADFGPHLKSYGTSVTGLNTTAIASSVLAVDNLVLIAKSIGVVDISGEKGPISNFGSQIQKLGSFIYSYSQWIDAVNWTTFAKSVEEINTIADLSDRLSLLDTGNLSTFGKDMQTMASNGIKLLSTAFTNAFSKVQANAQNLAKRAITGLNSVTPQFATIGINMMNGFINGLNSRAQAVYNTAQAIANRAAQIVRASLQIRSPSRVFKEIGMYSDLGFAEGLSDYAYTIENSAESVGKTAMDAMADSIQNAFEYIDDNPNFTPTISPVLDLSAIDEGMGRLGDRFNNPINANGFYRTTTDLAGVVMESARNNQNGASILNSMNQMMSELSNLSYAVEHMQIVMDSGMVVGEIAPKMDVALGRMVSYRGRGN